MSCLAIIDTTVILWCWLDPQCLMYCVNWLQIMHSVPGNKNVFKALIAAEYVGVDIKMVDNFQMGVSNKTPEFIKMNPLGKV